MNCKKCNNQIQENAEICDYCGTSQKEQTPVISAPVAEKLAGTKTYSSIFWKYFLIILLIGMIGAVVGTMINDHNIVYWTLMVAATYWFCQAVENAMRSIGKKNWWPVGLLGLIPLGFWVAYFVVRNQLKPRGKWGNDKFFLIFVVVIITIAIIGIIAGMIIVSMGGARSKARDARRQSDMRYLVTVQKAWFEVNNRYYTCGETSGDCKGELNNYPVKIGIASIPVDPVGNNTINSISYSYIGLDNTVGNGSDYCYYAKMENGGYYTASDGGNFLLPSPPETVNECKKTN